MKITQVILATSFLIAGMLTCSYDEYYNSESNSCYKCTDYSSKANIIGIKNCLSCIRSSSNSLQCTKCIPGAFININQCLLCPKGCSKCSSTYTCQQCNPGYFLASNYCYPCDLSICETCSGSPTNCETKQKIFIFPLSCVLTILLIACLIIKINYPKTSFIQSFFSLSGVIETVSIFVLTFILDNPLFLIGLIIIVLLFILNISSTIAFTLVVFRNSQTLKDWDKKNLYIGTIGIVSVLINRKILYIVFTNLFEIQMLNIQVNKKNRIIFFAITEVISVIVFYLPTLIIIILGILNTQYHWYSKALAVDAGVVLTISILFQILVLIIKCSSNKQSNKQSYKQKQIEEKSKYFNQTMQLFNINGGNPSYTNNSPNKINGKIILERLERDQ